MPKLVGSKTDEIILEGATNEQLWGLLMTELVHFSNEGWAMTHRERVQRGRWAYRVASQLRAGGQQLRLLD